mmetsp:Transcript_12450/g.37965  ORF Transcript_12450/g.37965 Transcript_12450/m.37965 type:complete len:82 (+) Transcript_12450:103-348(+)
MRTNAGNAILWGSCFVSGLIAIQIGKRQGLQKRKEMDEKYAHVARGEPLDPEAFSEISSYSRSQDHTYTVPFPSSPNRSRD